MDKITLAYLIGETAAAIDHATAVVLDRRQSISDRFLALAALDVAKGTFDRLFVGYLFFFPYNDEVTKASVRDWARLYCTENPDLLVQAEERLRAERGASE